ncbi:MAG: hypothetical protein ACK5Q5_08180, partial [Planctomycetaceae bacterium]
MPFLPLWRGRTWFCADSHASGVHELTPQSSARTARWAWRFAALVLAVSTGSTFAADMDDSQFNANLEAHAQSEARL